MLKIFLFIGLISVLMVENVTAGMPEEVCRNYAKQKSMNAAMFKSMGCQKPMKDYLDNKDDKAKLIKTRDKKCVDLLGRVGEKKFKAETRHTFSCDKEYSYYFGILNKSGDVQQKIDLSCASHAKYANSEKEWIKRRSYISWAQNNCPKSMAYYKNINSKNKNKKSAK
jgi:hypothetical protein